MIVEGVNLEIDIERVLTKVMMITIEVEVPGDVDVEPVEEETHTTIQMIVMRAMNGTGVPVVPMVGEVTDAR
jgi:hypothetical protein